MSHAHDNHKARERRRRKHEKRLVSLDFDMRYLRYAESHNPRWQRWWKRCVRLEFYQGYLRLRERRQ